MEKVKYLILGAGPSGLTFAHQLKNHGEDNFLVIEKEEEAGGLCRSIEVDGAPLDIGGGHILDVQRKKVNEFLFSFMPEEEWNLFERDSVIRYKDLYLQHPFEANIWQMDVSNQVDFLESISKAGCVKGEAMPKSFVDWIEWKLGEKIVEGYMLPYNQKMFGDNLEQLGTYWLEKLPDVSFRETLRSCLEKKAYGTEPGHVQFYYPKEYGYGEVWLRMAEAISDHMVYNSTVEKLDVNSRQIICSDGIIYEAGRIISTIPWSTMEIDGISEETKNRINSLRHTSVDIEYFPENLNTTAHWVYEPDPAMSYHRILVRHNFCLGSRGHWTETSTERLNLRFRLGEYHYMNEYAYPLNTVGKPEIMIELLQEMEAHKIYGLGRWGEHSHFNSDVVVERAMNLFERIKD